MAAVIHCINKVVALICCRWTDNHRVGVRVEDVMITDEPRIKTRTKIVLIIAFIIFFLCVVSLIIYMYIATNILDTEQPILKAVDVKNVLVKAYENDTEPLDAKLRLQVRFSVPDNIKAYPELGTFVLGTLENKYNSRRVFANSQYKISEDDQLLLLNFQMRDLEMKLYDQVMWIRVGGDFKMLDKYSGFHFFPKAYKHAYFVCDIAIKRVELDKIYHKQCTVTSQVPTILM